jgi:hypothetical protein
MLIREHNPYGSTSVNHHFEKLCGEAGIEMDGCDLSWHAIRRFAGSIWPTRKGCLPPASSSGTSLSSQHNSTVKRYHNSGERAKKNSAKTPSHSPYITCL